MTEPNVGDVVPAGIDYERLYEFRFREVDQDARQRVWDVIAPWLHRALGEPNRILDPAGGRGEFIRAVPARERWVVDLVDHRPEGWDADVKVVIGDARSVELPEAYFDGILVSNLLEHLASQEEVGAFLARLNRTLEPGGRLAVLGPNFRYCMREYFDCADHTLALTHVSVCEHLYAAGLQVDRVIPRFLPYSFRGRRLRAPSLVRAYLRCPPAWRVLGRQFLAVAHRP